MTGSSSVSPGNDSMARDQLPVSWVSHAAYDKPGMLEHVAVPMLGTTYADALGWQLFIQGTRRSSTKLRSRKAPVYPFEYPQKWVAAAGGRRRSIWKPLSLAPARPLLSADYEGVIDAESFSDRVAEKLSACLLDKAKCKSQLRGSSHRNPSYAKRGQTYGFLGGARRPQVG